MSAEYVINPITKRKVKVGSRKYMDLINIGAIKPKKEEKKYEQEYEEEEIEDEIIFDDEDFEFEEEEEEQKNKEEQEKADRYEDLDENDIQQIKNYVDLFRKSKRK